MSKLSITRRSFATGAAMPATGGLINPAEALTQGTPQSQPPKADTPLAQKAQAALAKLGPQSRAEVEMKVNEINRKYGDRLNDEQKTDILRILAEGQPPLEKMRAFVLQNSDQPATVLQFTHETKPAGKK